MKASCVLRQSGWKWVFDLGDSIESRKKKHFNQLQMIWSSYIICIELMFIVRIPNWHLKVDTFCRLYKHEIWRIDWIMLCCDDDPGRYTCSAFYAIQKPFAYCFVIPNDSVYERARIRTCVNISPLLTRQNKQNKTKKYFHQSKPSMKMKANERERKQ